MPGLQQLLGMLAAEGFTLPFPVDDVPVRLQDVTVIEREGKVRRRLSHSLSLSRARALSLSLVGRLLA